METNTEKKIIVNPVVTNETRKCKCCGKTLPLSDFGKTGKGYYTICKICRYKESGASEKFQNYTSRELIDELKARGYRGSLTKTIVENIKM